MDDADVARLATVADYQFGAGAGDALLAGDVEATRTTSGRPRQLHAAGDDGGHLATYTTDGRFTLGLAGARRLLEALEHPRVRVVVGDDSEPFVREGRNAFAKFVREVDPDVRPGDEVAVVHERGDLLAVGRAELSAVEMADFDVGVAVTVRSGAED